MHFLGRVNLHPPQQFCRLQDGTHEIDLIGTGGQEELAEVNERGLRQIAASVQVADAGVRQQPSVELCTGKHCERVLVTRTRGCCPRRAA